MEPYDKQPKNNPDSVWPKGTAAMMPGMILVGIGGLFLLDNLHIVHVSSWFAYWPVILIAFGLVKLVDSTFTGGRIFGGVLMALGGVFLADSLGYVRIEEMWPLILIAVGLFLIWTRTRPGFDYSRWWGGPRLRFQHWDKEEWRARFGDRFADRFAGMNFRGNMVHEYAVFGGTRRVVTDQDFKGGKISAVFGGTYLDLTGANMTGDSAVLEISSIYGGATVRIPTNWNLEVHGAGVFGGFVDRTVHPPNSPDMKHLIVRGAAIFGGVTFKN